MRARRAITALALPAALLAGCGGSASPPPAYIAAGNAICARQVAAVNRVPEPSTPEGALTYLPRVLPIMRREYTQLAALEMPAPARAHLHAALASARQLSTLLDGFLTQLRHGIVELASFAQVSSQSKALGAELAAQFHRAGLSACSR